MWRLLNPAGVCRPMQDHTGSRNFAQRRRTQAMQVASRRTSANVVKPPHHQVGLPGAEAGHVRSW